MEEKEIIDLFLLRSEEAIKETNIKYGTYFKKISYNILYNHLDVDEILNDAYMVAWNNIPPIIPNSLKFYISKIIRNLSLKRLEHSLAKKRKKDVSIILSELESMIPDENSSIDKIIESKRITEILNSFLSSVSEEECAIFVSRYYYFCSIKEISHKYNISERRIKYSLSKLTSKLKLKLKEEGIYNEII